MVITYGEKFSKTCSRKATPLIITRVAIELLQGFDLKPCTNLLGVKLVPLCVANEKLELLVDKKNLTLESKTFSSYENSS